MNTNLTFTEEHIWSNLGWVFCEISFRAPHWWWSMFGTAWAHTLGCRFYALAYDRTHELRKGRGPGARQSWEEKGGGTGPF